MYFEACKSILYSDTQIPDIFIDEYLPTMDGDCVKVYLYCLFLNKYNKQAAVKDISKKLLIDLEKVKQALTYLSGIGLISTNEKGTSIIIADLKEKEINKLYTLKTTSSVEDATSNFDRNKARNNTLSAINNKFFQGLMSPSWYNEIDYWYNRYRFDDDVMYTLFKYCYDNNALSRNYVQAVADSWGKRGIKNFFELEQYFEEQEKFKGLKGKIVKKLKLNRSLTEYESDMVEKWLNQYKYDIDILEIALEKTTSKTSPNLKYIDSIVTSWFSAGLKTKDEILHYMRTNNFRELQDRIMKKLKRTSLLTEFEVKYIEKWVTQFKYGVEVIELALEKTAGKPYAVFRYIDCVLSDWFKNGLKSTQEILAYDNTRRSTVKQAVGASAIPQHGNYEQRKYDDQYYDNLYENSNT
ncbi:MAG: DnaD domain protein [Clostridia bacterium]|nr:DnaD domain protein [Clostridia bacterium]